MIYQVIRLHSRESPEWISRIWVIGRRSSSEEDGGEVSRWGPRLVSRNRNRGKSTQPCSLGDARKGRMAIGKA